MTNFVPVSQQELHNPKPSDWLMLGGNMAHWNCSPLDQITRENVKQLQLVWARQQLASVRTLRPLLQRS